VFFFHRSEINLSLRHVALIKHKKRDNAHLLQKLMHVKTVVGKQCITEKATGYCRTIL